MIPNRSSWMLVLLIIFLYQSVKAQDIDSLLQLRGNSFQEYTQYKKNLGERTWIKLVNLSNLANNVIELDNELVDYYFSKGIDRNNVYKAKAEELNLEISLLKREAEIQKMVLEERKILFDTLLKIIGGVSLFFIVLLIFSIDRHIRYRNTKMELERTWAGQIDTHKESTSEQEFLKVNKEIRYLSTENTKLKDQVLELMNKIKEKEKVMDEELKYRKGLKEEIRNLITQIKSK
jgi:hypothetical protein